jgi:hypothetical protein
MPPDQDQLRIARELQRASRATAGNSREHAEYMSQAATSAQIATEATGRTQANLQGASDGAQSLGQSLQQIGERGSNTFTAFAQTLSSMVPDSLRKNYRQIQQMYGGLGDDILQPTNDMAIIMQGISRNVYSEFLTTSEKYEVQGMGLMSVFQDVNEAMSYFNDAAYDMVNGYRLLTDANEETAIEMGLFGRALGLTANETSTFLQREISLYGTSTGKMLNQATVYANRIAAVTGDSSKAIAKNIEAIISNTETFGNVTVEEAARMSASLRQLGIAYEDLNGMVGRFQGFDQAASSVSALTTVFGVQLDAMELMRLANEDQEGFLRRIRQDFLATGKAVGDLSLAEKRLIQDQLGLSDVESVERLLDPTAAITSFEQLSAATRGTGEDSAEAMQLIQDDLQVIDNAAEMTAERMRAHMEEAMREGLVDSAMEAEQAFIRFGGQAVEALVDPTEDVEALSAAIQTLSGLVGEEAATGLGQFVDALGGDLLHAGQQIGMLVPVEGEDSLGSRLIASFDGILGEGGPLGNITSEMTSQFNLGWSSGFNTLTADYQQMMEDWQDVQDEAGQTGRSMSPQAELFYNGWGSAFEALSEEYQQTWESIEDITSESLESMLKDSNSAMSQMAQELGRTYTGTFQEFKEGTTEAERDAIAERLKLGEDYEEELKAIFESGRLGEGASMQALEDQAAEYLDVMRSAGEVFGADELKEIESTLGLQAIETEAYMGQGMMSGIEQSDEDRAYILRRASRRAVMGEEEEEEGGSRSSSSNAARDQRESSDTEALQQIARNTDPAGTDPIHITVNLNTTAIIDQILDAPRGSGGGRILISQNPG